MRHARSGHVSELSPRIGERSGSQREDAMQFAQPMARIRDAQDAVALPRRPILAIIRRQ